MTEVLDTPVPETPAPEAAPTTFTQEDVNRINAADRRKDREAMSALQAELDALKPKAEQYDALKAEQETALEKANREREEALAQKAELEARVKTAETRKQQETAAMEAAKKLGYPSIDKAISLARFIEGDDLGAAAEALFEEFKPANSEVPTVVHDVLPTDPKDDPVRKAFLGVK